MKSETPRYLSLAAIAALLACSDGQASPSGGLGGDGGVGASGDGGDVAADGGAFADSGTIVPSSGCGAGGATGFQEKTITVSGLARRYQLFVPAAVDVKKPARLVFVFHGLGGNAAQIRAYLGLEAEAGADALLVYPEGVVRLQGRTGWSEEDLPFFDAMVTEIAGARCVDQKRVFATGHSFGGYMSNLVGCLRGDVVRAIAPVSGGLVASGACKGPVAAWLAHGDQDPTVPQSEGIAARDRWIKANGCAATSKATAPGQCVSYDGCSPDHPVTWCSFPGGHYPLPGYTKQAIWDFFKAM